MVNLSNPRVPAPEGLAPSERLIVDWHPDPAQVSTVDRILLHLGQRQAELGRLVHTLLQDHHFGFTLFGGKPVAIADMTLAGNEQPRVPNYSEYDALGEVLELLPSTHFHFYISKTLNGTVESLILVNLRAAQEVISANTDLFDALGSDALGSVELLEARLRGGSGLTAALGGRHDLAGMLCGIPRRSAERFQALERMNLDALPFYTADGVNGESTPVRPMRFRADTQDPDLHQKLRHYRSMHRALDRYMREQPETIIQKFLVQYRFGSLGA